MATHENKLNVNVRNIQKSKKIIKNKTLNKGLKILVNQRSTPELLIPTFPQIPSAFLLTALS